jgi:hypothetical protein
LATCGVERGHDGSLILRKRVLPNKEAWILTNPTVSVITEHLPVAGWLRVEDLLGGAVTRNGDVVELTVNPLDVRVILVSR